MNFKAILIFILLPGIGPVFSQDDPIRRELQKLIRYETGIRFERTPGFIVAMLEKDTTFIFSFGQRSLEDSKPLVKQDIFEIGGVTKLFTALVTLQVAEEYSLDLHQSINLYLENPNPALDSCTLFTLMTHTSGFPKYPAGWGIYEKETNNPFAHFAPHEVETFLNQFSRQDQSPPEYLYSHLNFVVLQWILTKITGKEYEKLLSDYIHPFHLAASPTTLPTVSGYGLDIKLKPPWTSNAYQGSVGIKTTLDDLVRFCRLTLENPVFQKLLHPIPMRTGKNKGWVSLGWQVLPVPKNRFVYAHTGRTEGHHCFVGLFPETSTGVIILSNSAVGTDPLGLSVLTMMNQNWKRK